MLLLVMENEAALVWVGKWKTLFLLFKLVVVSEFFLLISNFSSESSLFLWVEFFLSFFSFSPPF